MAVISRPAYVVAASIFLSGCITTATAISDTQRLVSAEPLQTEFIVTTSTGAQQTWSPAGVDGQEMAYLGYVLLDSGKKCQAFADRLSVAQRGVDTSFDILTVILSALATAFTPLSTVHGLTAAATISAGTKAAIDANVYAKATAALILQEINRTYYVHVDNYRKDLLAMQEVVPTIEVSRIEAIHRECSLDFAVASLSQVGAAAAASIGATSGAVAGAAVARQKGLTPEAGAIVGAAAGAAAGAATGSSGGMSQSAANAGATAGATIGTAVREPGAALPPPVPIVPPSVSVAPTPLPLPPRPPPAAPRIPSRPTTPARSELFRALLSDAQGSRPFDQTRIRLMRQCWTEVLAPPPENFATWLQEATDQSLITVATCINGKATAEISSSSGATIPSAPPSPARSEVFLALRSDAEGKQPFDPARVRLMRQCWNELLRPPPDNFATWLQQASDQNLHTVASCINGKAAAGNR